ncbi:hypothetical protein D3C78_1218130 [compost metagenome]
MKCKRRAFFEARERTGQRQRQVVGCKRRDAGAVKTHQGINPGKQRFKHALFGAECQRERQRKRQGGAT